jgi:hypothetical protein
MNTRLELTRSLLLVAVTVGSAPGCIFFDGGGSAGSGADDDDWDAEAPSAGFLRCEADVSVSFEAEAELLVEDLRVSLSEMIGCGRLTVDLAGAVRSGIVDAILDNRPDATPAGWRYEGNGLFTTSAARADMQTRFFLAGDFSFGSRGDVVEHNVFRVDSYLVGARLRIPDPLSFRAELHYDAAGPLVELLGYGTEPPNPILVDLDTLTGLGDEIAALQFESDVSVEDVDGDSTILYRLGTDRMPANALLTGAGLRYRLESLVARRDGMDTEVTGWSSEFFVSGTVQGSVSFDLDIDARLRCEGEIRFPELPRPSGD